jgi:nucleoside-diphosphate-sugar epimerase
MTSLSDFEYGRAFDGASALVTGGAGFIGSHIVRRLVQLGARVRVVDDLSTGKADNLLPNVDFRRGSILDRELMRDAIGGADYVFHEAAMVSVPLSVEQPRACFRTNIEGTEQMLELAADAGVRRLVLASSAAVYGDEPDLPSRESDPIRCCSPYAASKAAGEVLLQAFGRCTTLSTVSLRYFNIFGPRQRPDSPYAAAISIFADRLKSEAPPTIFGDGSQTRDFTFVDNVVHANLLAAAHGGELCGEVFNVGTGRRVSLLDVLEHMGAALGARPSPVFAATRPGDVPHSSADITRASEVLGYEPIVDFETGIAETLRTL